MSATLAERFAAGVAGLWTGVMVAIGFIAAPTLFVILPRSDAGRVAARLFEIDADVGLAAAVVLLVLSMRSPRAQHRVATSRFSVELMLVLAALFCIVAGYFAVQPMIETARRGEGGPSFAVLHGVASAFFVVKVVVVAVLAWRLTGRRAGATAAATTS